jgi:hypothetical protein
MDYIPEWLTLIPDKDDENPEVFSEDEYEETEDSCEEEASSSQAEQSLEGEDDGPSTSGTSSSKSKSRNKGKSTTRCHICRKKVGLTGRTSSKVYELLTYVIPLFPLIGCLTNTHTGFTCRCGGLFCAIHRYSDKHECHFDYRKLGAEEIRKNNPVIESEKIHKI